MATRSQRPSRARPLPNRHRRTVARLMIMGRMSPLLRSRGGRSPRTRIFDRCTLRALRNRTVTLSPDFRVVAVEIGRAACRAAVGWVATEAAMKNRPGTGDLAEAPAG